MVKINKSQSAEPKESYVVAGAVIECSCGTMKRTLRLPLSHGVYINGGKAQMNIDDCKPNVNIMPFKGCKSPDNPDESTFGVIDKAIGSIVPVGGKAKDMVCEMIGDEVSSALGFDYTCKTCKPKISMKWTNGKKDTLVDGKPALLNTSQIKCVYGGTIKIIKDGQEK